MDAPLDDHSAIERRDRNIEHVAKVQISGELGKRFADVGEHLATIVPAQPGQELVLVSADSDDGRPTELWVARYPIIAWRVEVQPDAAPTPITPDDMGSTSSWRRFIVLPDGRLIEPYVGEHDSLEAMKTALLEEAQGAWDAAQAAKVKPVA